MVVYYCNPMKATNSKPRFAHKIFHFGNNAVITSHATQKAPLDPNNLLNVSKEAGYESKPKSFMARIKKKKPTKNTRENFRNSKSFLTRNGSQTSIETLFCHGCVTYKLLT